MRAKCLCVYVKEFGVSTIATSLFFNACIAAVVIVGAVPPIKSHELPYATVLLPVPSCTTKILPVVPAVVGGEEGDGGVGVLLDNPQGGSQGLGEPLLVLDGLGAGTEALQQELIILLQPNVHSSHGAVGEGADDHLLMDAVIDRQHANLK